MNKLYFTFTPVFDFVVADLGPVSAFVYGRIWRFCQMKHKCCYASYATIAESLKLSRRTIIKHVKLLVDHGYLLIEKRAHGQQIIKLANYKIDQSFVNNSPDGESSSPPDGESSSLKDTIIKRAYKNNLIYYDQLTKKAYKYSPDDLNNFIYDSDGVPIALQPPRALRHKYIDHE